MIAMGFGDDKGFLTEEDYILIVDTGGRNSCNGLLRFGGKCGRGMKMMRWRIQSVISITQVSSIMKM